MVGGCNVWRSTTRTNVNIVILKEKEKVIIDYGKHFHTQFLEYLRSSDKEKESDHNVCRKN